MKVDQLFQRAKSSPSSFMPRGARSVASLGGSSDFAGALTEARRKPEPKAAEVEPPTAKKSAAAKKSRSAKDDEPPIDDAPASDSSRAADEAESQPAVDENEPAATDEDAGAGEDDPKEAPASDEGEAESEKMALAQAVVQPSLTPQSAVPEAEVEATAAAPQAVAPMLKGDRHAAGTQPEAGEADEESAEIAGRSQPVAATPLKGLETLGELSPEDSDADAEPLAKPSVAPTSQSATPAAAEVDSDSNSQAQTKSEDTAERTVPAVAGELAMTAETQSAADGASAAPVATVGGDVTTTTATAHVQPEAAKTQAPAAAPAAQPPVTPQAHFMEMNYPKIVTALRTELLPQGGTMQIRLDPPELGALQVLVHMQDGVITASFQTSNDEATKLLSHSLSQLKQVLESQGVSVEKLQVSQAPKDQQACNDDARDQPRDQQGDAHRQEQQRKEMLRRMWRRLSNGSDPLDLVA